MRPNRPSAAKPWQLFYISPQRRRMGILDIVFQRSEAVGGWEQIIDLFAVRTIFGASTSGPSVFSFARICTGSLTDVILSNSSFWSMIESAPMARRHCCSRRHVRCCPRRPCRRIAFHLRLETGRVNRTALITLTGERFVNGDICPNGSLLSETPTPIQWWRLSLSAHRIVEHISPVVLPVGSIAVPPRLTADVAYR